jgi:hypothetical protein
MPSEEMTVGIEQAIDEMMTGDTAAEIKTEETATGESTEESTNVSTDESDDGQITDREAGEGVRGTTEESTGDEADTGTGEGTSEGAGDVGGAEVDSVAASSTLASPISDQLLARAVNIGFSLADARTAESEESLERIVSSLEDAQAAITEADTTTESEDPFADLPKLDPEVYEPEVIKSFEQLKDVIKQQAEKLQDIEGRQEQQAQATQEARAAEVEQWFDGRVSALGEDFVEALGSGSFSSLDHASPQYAKRSAIADQVGVLLAGYQAQGMQPPSDNELFDAAVRLVLPGEHQKISERKLESNLKKRAGQHLNRASSKKAVVSQTPEEYAVGELGRKFNIPE